MEFVVESRTLGGALGRGILLSGCIRHFIFNFKL